MLNICRNYNLKIFWLGATVKPTVNYASLVFKIFVVDIFIAVEKLGMYK